MAIFEGSYFSDALRRGASFSVYLPNDIGPEGHTKYFDRPAKVLFLLHGYTGTRADWIKDTSILSLAARYNLAVVCPSGENSFYLDGEETGRQYQTYVGQELVEYVRKTFGLSSRREDTFIGGISMGGFGAVHTGLAYPETFSKIISLSAALIVHKVAAMKPDDPNLDGIANYAYYRLMFGEPGKLLESRNNPEVLVRELMEKGSPLPALYLAIGTEDFLYEDNQIFRRFLESQNFPFTYREGPGVHDYNFWNPQIDSSLRWLMDEEDGKQGTDIGDI